LTEENGAIFTRTGQSKFPTGISSAIIETGDMLALTRNYSTSAGIAQLEALIAGIWIKTVKIVHIP